MNGRVSRPRVVIVGAGFGGLNAAKALKNAPVSITLLDRNNYHLFQPLLYQVATGGVSESQIAYPLRAAFHSQANLRVYLADVTKIDLEGRRVISPYGTYEYDYLILAPGGQTNFFGLESVERNGFELKGLENATDIRNHILYNFERATEEEDPDECVALRTFVVVGGGPTGVESSGALSELIRLVLQKDFPTLSMTETRVILLEAMGTILPGYPPELSQAAEETLRRKQVEVRCNSQVVDYDGQTVRLKSGETIEAYTLIWAAGVKAANLLADLPFEKGKQGRVVVEPTLQVPGHPEVYVIGDGAYMEQKGQPLPMVAPVAIQQAKTAANNIKNQVSGRPLENFRYKDPGSLATIGRNAAVAKIGRFEFHGILAWFVWLGVHLVWLIGFRNRLLVMINWAWDYIFYDQAVRLITEEPSRELQEEPWRQ